LEDACLADDERTRGAERGIRRIRAQNVLLDADLAALYGVEVRTLNQAVSRNPAAVFRRIHV
jgi:DNA-binding transcriptional regulator YiaG